MYKKVPIWFEISFDNLLVIYFGSHCNMRKKNRHCAKSVRIRGYCIPRFPANWENTDQSKVFTQ